MVYGSISIEAANESKIEYNKNYETTKVYRYKLRGFPIRDR